MIPLFVNERKIMKKLGLVGGTGPESTIPYYRGIVYAVQKQSGKKEFPPLVIDSIDVFHVMDYCARKDYGSLTAYLAASVKNLAAAGADFAALTGNTPHIVFDDLTRLSPIPLVSIPEAAADYAAAKHYKKLALLGTAFTMKEDFFKKPFRRKQIDLLIPDETEQALLQNLIENELELGIKKESTLHYFQQVISRLKTQGAEAVILGCTELPLILNDNTSPLPCLDTMEIHIEKLVQLIINPSPAIR